MARCPSCSRFFNVPEDEQGQHGCPRCGEAPKIENHECIDHIELTSLFDETKDRHERRILWDGQCTICEEDYQVEITTKIYKV
jgi:hypothetical protein